MTTKQKSIIAVTGTAVFILGYLLSMIKGCDLANSGVGKPAADTSHFRVVPYPVTVVDNAITVEELRDSLDFALAALAKEKDLHAVTRFRLSTLARSVPGTETKEDMRDSVAYNPDTGQLDSYVVFVSDSIKTRDIIAWDQVNNQYMIRDGVTGQWRQLLPDKKIRRVINHTDEWIDLTAVSESKLSDTLPTPATLEYTTRTDLQVETQVKSGGMFGKDSYQVTISSNNPHSDILEPKTIYMPPPKKKFWETDAFKGVILILGTLFIKQ